MNAKRQDCAAAKQTQSIQLYTTVFVSCCDLFVLT